MSDPLMHVGKGGFSPLMKDRTLVNGVIDMYRWWIRTHRGSATGAGTTSHPDNKRSCTLVHVRNDTGSALSAFQVIKTGSPIIAAADDPHDTFAHPVYPGSVPAAASDPFAILQGPLSASGDYSHGYAAVVGDCAAWVNVSDTSHTYAQPSPGVTANLVSADCGPARILSTLTGTGLQLVEIRFQGGGMQQGEGAPSVPIKADPVNDEPATELYVTSQPGADPETSETFVITVGADDGTGDSFAIMAFYPTGTNDDATYTIRMTPDAVTETYVINGETGTITTTESAGEIIQTGANTVLAGSLAAGGGGLAWTFLGSVTAADLTDADLEQDVNVYSLPAGKALHAILMRTVVAGAGGGVGQVTVDLLLAGNSLGLQPLNGFVLDSLAQDSSPSGWGGPVVSLSAASQFALRVTADVNVADLTAGQWDLWGVLADVF